MSNSADPASVLPEGFNALGAVHLGLLLPAFAAWIALLLPGRPGLALLVVASGSFWLYAHRALPDGWLPAAYLRLRRNLSLAVCSLLTLGLLALG